MRQVPSFASATCRHFWIPRVNILQFGDVRLAMGKRLIIEGRVQGVGYRASLAKEAIALGLYGWVRNRRDGSVEACVDGDMLAIEAIILWAKRGPPAAQVSNVTVEDLGAQVSSNGIFKIFPTQ